MAKFVTNESETRSEYPGSVVPIALFNQEHPLCRVLLLSMFTNMTCCIVQPNHTADCWLSSCKYLCPLDMLYFIFLLSKKVIMDDYGWPVYTALFQGYITPYFDFFNTSPPLKHVYESGLWLHVQCYDSLVPQDHQESMTVKLPLHLIIYLYSVSPVLKEKEGRPSSPTFLLLGNHSLGGSFL